MTERRGSGYPGHVERLPDATIERSVEDGVTVVRLGAPAQPRVDASVREAVERHHAETHDENGDPINPGRVQRAGARVERFESPELDENGRPMLTRVTIR